MRSFLLIFFICVASRGSADGESNDAAHSGLRGLHRSYAWQKSPGHVLDDGGATSRRSEKGRVSHREDRKKKGNKKEAKSTSSYDTFTYPPSLSSPEESSSPSVGGTPSAVIASLPPTSSPLETVVADTGSQATNASTQMLAEIPICPFRYSPSNTTYNVGDTVEVDMQVYRCQSIIFCNFATADSLWSDSDKESWEKSWILVGDCEVSSGETKSLQVNETNGETPGNNSSLATGAPVVGDGTALSTTTVAEESGKKNTTASTPTVTDETIVEETESVTVTTVNQTTVMHASQSNDDATGNATLAAGASDVDGAISNTMPTTLVDATNEASGNTSLLMAPTNTTLPEEATDDVEETNSNTSLDALADVTHETALMKGSSVEEDGSLVEQKENTTATTDSVVELVPTTTDLPPCPSDYGMAVTTYLAGDHVTVNSRIFKCSQKEGYEKYCNVAVWDERLGDENEHAWDMWLDAWEDIGPCLPTQKEILEEEAAADAANVNT